MQKTRLTIRRRKGERGQTIVLVAVSLVTLLAMAALAVDVVTLYVARSEMQRAADAAALAAAKAFVDSGVTSLATGDPNYAAVSGMAQTMATTVINSILPQNKVSGVTPTLVGAPAFDFTRPGNPQVTVTLQRNNLPTFFSRIWSSNLATVSASASAEAYNASRFADEHWKLRSDRTEMRKAIAGCKSGSLDDGAARRPDFRIGGDGSDR